MTIKKTLVKTFLSLAFINLSFASVPGVKTEVNYTEGYVKVTAMACSQAGVPDILAEAQAYEAARIVALKNLAEAIEGVHITANETVKNMQFRNSLISSRVKAIIKGAAECPDTQPHFIYRESSGIGCVTNYCLMTKILYGPNGTRLLIPVIQELKKEGYPTKPPKAEEIAQNPQEVQTAQQPDLKEVDGVIIDVRDFPDFTPSAAPIIVTKTMGGQYKPVFAATMVDESAIRRKGAVVGIVATRGQLNNLLQAWNIKHPLYIKAVGITPDGAIVISNQDAIKLITADQKNNFISKGNVIIWMSPATAQNY